MIESQRLSKFDETEGDNLNWNGWVTFGKADIGYNYNSIETSIVLTNEENVKDRINAYFQVSDNLGVTDFSDYLIDNEEQGALEIIQRPLVNDIIEPSEDDIELVELKLNARGHDVELDSLAITDNILSDFPYAQLPQLPTVLKAEQSYELILTLSPNEQTKLSDGELIKIDLSSLGPEDKSEHTQHTDTKMIDEKQIDDIKTPITFSGEPTICYFKNAPSEIVIDGAFADWANIQPNFDYPGEYSINGNPDIDIRDFRNVNERDKLSFYLMVDGTIMNGANVLAKPIIYSENSNGAENINDNGTGASNVDKNEKEPLHGLDVAYVFIEIDTTSGLQIDEFKENGINIRANYMVELLGRDGIIHSKNFYKYNRDNTNWELITNIEIKAATDAHRLEAQIDITQISKLLNLNPEQFQSARILYQMTDWSKGFDIGIKLPEFSGESIQQNSKNALDSLTPPRGTRGPPGGWPAQWYDLTPSESSSDSTSLDNNFEINSIYANDTLHILYLRITLTTALAPPAGGTYDFYFNVSSTKWYRIRLHRNSTISWDFELNWTTKSSPPDDNDPWTLEENHTVSGTGFSDSFDGASIGFQFDFTNSDVRFWINKTNLSQGFGSLGKPNNCTMFADAHEDNETQGAMVDRAPNLGISWYNPWSKVIPEYDWFALPIPIIFMFLLLLATNRKVRFHKGKRKKIVNYTNRPGGELA